MFEKYKVPALFMAKNPVLTSFATRSATSLVVDYGGGSTTIAPVHEGYVLQKVYEQVMESINKCDVDIGRELYSSITINFNS
ncbi:unnamed protein product [Brassica napus]|uniref:(rape) hypothetical protein n=1 Tax=Brassica napus TaxID=3708 RepID=A0A816UUH7_BRANA|nr:unnamed protein product [Brassica napus]